jgi:hypothetical protein
VNFFYIQKRLDSEAKRLEALSNEFSKQTKAFQTIVSDFNVKLKEIGDLESW